MEKKAFRLIIKGLVQGVGFRISMRKIALANQVYGWVRNRQDGSVEAWVEGDPQNLDRVIEWTKRGPMGARVSHVEIIEVPVQGFHEFKIR